MNGISVIFNQGLFLGENSLVLIVIIFNSHGSILSFQNFNIDVF